ncbi:hypothetical protein FSP39_007131 [Pinctada imbricata]|uniref:STAS domain-containing protein n=1 Tax=Pinctada imbricata TaxID=66713 RepID=A0AA88YC12_PINIB|nr:hypothetical protein FSP39_007131 [Pinctada imbricata]
MDPKARRTLLMELSRPRESFRTQMLVKSKEKVKKRLQNRIKVSSAYQRVRDNIPKCKCTRELSRAFCTELFPFWGVIKRYSLRRYLLADFVAGMTVGIIHIPQGMAYGFLSNLPPVYGLYTSFFPVLLYFFFGSSQKISMGTFAVTSLMIGAVVTNGLEKYRHTLPVVSTPESTTLTTNHTYNITVNSSVEITTPHVTTEQDVHDAEIQMKVAFAMSVSFLAGLMQFALGCFRFGFLASFMSDPLISGFTTAAAVHVFSSQVKFLFGIQVATYSGPVQTHLCKCLDTTYFYRDFFQNLHNTNPVTATASVTCIFVLILIKEGINNNPTCKKDLPVPIPIELMVVVAATVISHYTRINQEFQVEVVGVIPVGLPPPNMKNLVYAPELIGDAIGIAFVAFATSYAMAKILAEKSKEDINANQELVANGICNLVGALFSSFCSAASLSRSLVQEEAGGKTQIVGIFSSILVLIVLLYIGPMFAALPTCILACVSDGYAKGNAVWFVTFIATVILDVGLGLMVGVIFALYFVLRNTQSPNICMLGRVPGTNAYKDVKLSRTLISVPGIKIFRFEANLYFANAEQFRDRLYERTGLNPKKLKTKKQKALYKALLQRKRELELAEIEQQAEEKKKQKELKKMRSSIEEEVDKEIGDELTEEQETILNKDKKELQSRFSKAWLPPVHTVVLDFSVVSYIDTVAIKVLSQILEEYKEVGIKVFLSGCREDVRKIIKKADFYQSIDYNCLYFTIHEAVVIAQELNIDTEVGNVNNMETFW